MIYPLNVSRDCSLLLLLGGGGRMLSVTGAVVMPGEPSSFIMKRHQHCFTGESDSLAHPVKSNRTVCNTKLNLFLLTVQGKWFNRLQLYIFSHSSIRWHTDNRTVERQSIALWLKRIQSPIKTIIQAWRLMLHFASLFHCSYKTTSAFSAIQGAGGKTHLCHPLNTHRVDEPLCLHCTTYSKK